MPKKPLIESYKNLQKKAVHINSDDWERFTRLARKQALSSYQHALAILSTLTLKEASEFDTKAMIKQQEFVRAHQTDKEKVKFVSLFVPHKEERGGINEIVSRLKAKDRSITLSDLLRYLIHRAVEQEGADIHKDKPIKKEGVERIQVNFWAEDFDAVLKHVKDQGKVLYAFFLEQYPSFSDAQFRANHIPRKPGPKRAMRTGQDPRGTWTPEPLRVKNGLKITDEMRYDLVNKATHEVYPCPSTGWKYPQAVVDAMNIEGNILWPIRKNGKVCYKKFRADYAEFEQHETKRTFITLYPELLKQVMEQSQRLGAEPHEVLRAFVRFLALKLKTNPDTE